MLQSPLLGTTGLVPGLVQLQASSDGREPSLTLHWEMPSNISTVQEITAHEIRFREHHTPQNNSSQHQSTSQHWRPPRYQMQPQYQKLPPVNGHCRKITLGRKDGLKPLTSYDLEVRTISSDGEGPWTAITKYFCKLCIPNMVLMGGHIHTQLLLS